MTTRSDVIAEARTWINTPFRHAGREKGRGADCIGMIARTGIDLGLVPAEADTRNYSRIPEMAQLRQRICRYADPISLDEARPGDILEVRFWRTREPTHFVLLTDEDRGIHCTEKGRGVCVEQPLGPWRHGGKNKALRGTVEGAFRYHGLED